MEDEEAGLSKQSKRFSEKGGEVDYKTKSGTAWSHNFLNQKPWHPLSYPNQRRKWIAEQTHAQRERRTDEVAREYAQEQDFLRQTSLLSQKEKEKVDLMQAVSFMYVRPPGYNAESAKAAEIIEERRRIGETDSVGATSSSVLQETAPVKVEKKKPRPKDVFGRSLPTEEEFAVLKNAPRLETGVAGRAKPFGVEVRNVKCARCGTYGHQSGDRECPMKDAIMPNEESRLKRDDPLTAIMAHMDSSEPLKWELKQKPGISPPRGGFQLDDPNQQIVAEDIFDEYGGFLSGGSIPEFLTNFSAKKHKKNKNRSKRKHKKRRSSSSSFEESSSDTEKDKKHAKTERRSRHIEKTLARPRYEGDNGETNSITLNSERRSSPGDSNGDSNVYRKSAQHMQKRESNTASSSHVIMPDGSRAEKRYDTKNRSNIRRLQAGKMDSKKYLLSHGRTREFPKPHNSSLCDSERTLRSNDKRLGDQRRAQCDTGYSSSENSGPDRHMRKHNHNSYTCILTDKLQSDRYTSKHRC